MKKDKFSKNVGEPIDLNDARKWIEKYKSKNKDGIHAYFFGADIINTILNQPEAVGMRICLGYDKDDKKRDILKMVLVGTREDGSNIWPEDVKSELSDVQGIMSMRTSKGTVADGGMESPPH